MSEPNAYRQYNLLSSALEIYLNEQERTSIAKAKRAKHLKYIDPRYLSRKFIRIQKRN